MSAVVYTCILVLFVLIIVLAVFCFTSLSPSHPHKTATLPKGQKKPKELKEDKCDGKKETDEKKCCNACSDKDSADVAITWLELLYDIVKAEGLSPPVASRVYALVAIALYESVVPGSRTHQSLHKQLNGFNNECKDTSNADCLCWSIAANSAIATTILTLLPSLSPASSTLVHNLDEKFQTALACDTLQNRTASIAFGESVSSTVVQWASTDGFTQLNNCTYQPTVVPGAWVPTPPAFNPKPLQPCWGQLRPMVLEFAQQCPPPGPLPFSTDPTSTFYAAAQQVYQLTPLDADQQMIASFWADNPTVSGTPPGHWIAIVSQIARNKALPLMRAAEAYARTGLAVNDAFIACWNSKYIYNLQRPVTYIQAHIDAAWTPFLVTPAFPSYTSGHSSQSAAVAAVLTNMFGPQFAFVDTTHIDHNVPPLVSRPFASFEQAAQEAAVSRLYGGIHYSFDNNDGYDSGTCIGAWINKTVSFCK